MMAAPSPGWTQPAPVTGPEVIAYTQRKPAGFALGQAVIPVQNNAGILGALAIVATHVAIARMAGAKAVERGEISDPAIALSRDVAGILAEQRDAAVAERPIAVDREKPKAIAKAAGDARYVVDVRTTNWDFRYENGGQPKVAYAAELSVIEGRTGKLVVQDNCVWMPPRIDANAMTSTDPESPVRRYFGAASAACREQFRVAMRNLALGPTRAAPAVEPRRAPPPAVAVAQLPPPARVDAEIIASAGETRPVAPPVYYEPPPRYVPPPAPPPPALSPEPRPPEVRDYAWVEQRETERYREERRYGPPPPPPEYRSAGRDANGFLVWPGKRP